jgi:hypothetical protein
VRVAVNLGYGWFSILAGLMGGLLLGLFFHGEGWPEGYPSFRRRMLRLGHVALVALDPLNLIFALTAPASRVGVGIVARGLLP